MELLKIIKSNIIYYYIAALAFVLLLIAANYIFTVDNMGNSTLNFFIILPVVSVILGFLAGGAKSYVKWGFPIYIGLLSFCLSIFLMNYDYWIMAIIGCIAALAGVIIRHLIHAKGGRKQ